MREFRGGLLSLQIDLPEDAVRDVFNFLAGSDRLVSMAEVREIFYPEWAAEEARRRAARRRRRLENRNGGSGKTAAEEAAAEKERERKLERAELLVRLGAALRKRRITPKKLMARLDADGSGGVKLGEFEVGLRNVLGLEAEFSPKDCRTLFKALDADGSKILGADELRAALEGDWKAHRAAMRRKRGRNALAGRDEAPGREDEDVEAEDEEAQAIAEAIQLKMDQYDAKKEFRLFCDDRYGSREGYRNFLKRTLARDVRRRLRKERAASSEDRGAEGAGSPVDLSSASH
jgi:Ca2+-binding EF-hand superfamily protein